MEIIFIPLSEIQDSQNRLLAIMEIEHDVNLIKEMFLQLNSIIEEQQPLIDTIVVHIEEAKVNSKVANEDIKISDEYRQGFSSKLKYLVIIGLSIICIIKVI
jgi:t-SNARE complex subunit (syntaxin)